MLCQDDRLNTSMVKLRTLTAIVGVNCFGENKQYIDWCSAKCAWHKSWDWEKTSTCQGRNFITLISAILKNLNSPQLRCTL